MGRRQETWVLAQSLLEEVKLTQPHAMAVVEGQATAPMALQWEREWGAGLFWEVSLVHLVKTRSRKWGQSVATRGNTRSTGGFGGSSLFGLLMDLCVVVVAMVVLSVVVSVVVVVVVVVAVVAVSAVFVVAELAVVDLVARVVAVVAVGVAAGSVAAESAFVLA